MPKQRRPARSRRRRPGRPPSVPAAATPAAPIAAEEEEEPLAVAGPRQTPVRAERAERPVHRTVLVDYSYVTRDLRRILMLATAVIVTIIVLSFFLP